MHDQFEEKTHHILIPVPFHSIQGVIELCLLILHHIGAHRNHHFVQHGSQLRRPCFHDVWMVSCRFLHLVCRLIDGRDLFIVPDVGWLVLLERKALREGMGPVCFLDYWMVQYRRAGMCVTRFFEMSIAG